MDRLTRQELENYCDNAGLTIIQKDILRLRYFDERDLSVLQICNILHISERSYFREQKKLLTAIAKYENLNK